MDMEKVTRYGSAAMMLALLSQPLCAQETSRVQNETANQRQTMAQAQDRDRIYGSELMTQQERNEYQNQMRQLNTEQERAQLRAQHHEQMNQRAKAQGMTSPMICPPTEEHTEMVQGRAWGKARVKGGGQAVSRWGRLKAPRAATKAATEAADTEGHAACHSPVRRHRGVQFKADTSE